MAWIPRNLAPEAAPGLVQVAPAVAAAPPCTSSDCNPNGAHAVHTSFGCGTCHQMHDGVFSLIPGGLAVIQPTSANPNPPLPSFDPLAKTCSNVACHGMPTGVYSYYFQGGDGDAELRAAAYGGYVTTPNWYTQGAGCSACHGAPPATGVWHSGQHVPFSPAANTCQFCHPDASGTAATGIAITQPALHRNGTVDVQARFTSVCFGCH